MNSPIPNWVRAAIHEVGAKAKELDPQSANQVYDAAMKRYVEGTPRCWWMALKTGFTLFDSTETSLDALIPQAYEYCYLIPEAEAGPCVFEIRTGDLMAVLADCPYFEYYVLATDLSWLIIESDHNVFYVCSFEKQGRDGQCG